MEKEKIIKFIEIQVKQIAEEAKSPKSFHCDKNSNLIGKNAILTSMGLVELMVALEDFCSQNNIDFDWTSDSMMSEMTSVYRTIETLADYILTKCHE